jgi:hypothetical protein
MSNTTIPPVGQQRLVRLKRCTAKRCKHTYPKDETAWVVKKNGCDKQGACPKCGCQTFHAVNAAGQIVKLSEWEDAPWPPEANEKSAGTDASEKTP